VSAVSAAAFQSGRSILEIEYGNADEDATSGVAFWRLPSGLVAKWTLAAFDKTMGKWDPSVASESDSFHISHLSGFISAGICQYWIILDTAASAACRVVSHSMGPRASHESPC
jgi:hypothetical protein